LIGVALAGGDEQSVDGERRAAMLLAVGVYLEQTMNQLEID
jgi:hypothetical protein